MKTHPLLFLFLLQIAPCLAKQPQQISTSLGSTTTRVQSYMLDLNMLLEAHNLPDGIYVIYISYEKLTHGITIKSEPASIYVTFHITQGKAHFIDNEENAHNILLLEGVVHLETAVLGPDIHITSSFSRAQSFAINIHSIQEHLHLKPGSYQLVIDSCFIEKDEDPETPHAQIVRTEKTIPFTVHESRSASFANTKESFLHLKDVIRLYSIRTRSI